MENRPTFPNTAALIPAGLPRILYRPIQPLVEKFLGYATLRKWYADEVTPPYDAVTLSQRVLARTGVAWTVSKEDRRQLERIDGPLVLAANHPFGGLEFLALVQLMDLIRPGGWKFLANELVTSIPGFQDKFIPLDPLGWSGNAYSKNQRGLLLAMRFLRNGGLLGLFPAGRVSHSRGGPEGMVTEDRAWSVHLLPLAVRANASVACLHIPGQNSRLFMSLPKQWARLRALFLCRELIHPSVERVDLRLASVYPPAEAKRLFADPRGTEKLRAICHLRADRDLSPPPTGRTPASLPEITPMPDQETLRLDLERLSSMSSRWIASHGKYDLWFFRGDEAPNILRAIGCQREETFRAASQGSGSSCDISSEDRYYHHLILWDREREIPAGAYRVGMVDEILAEHGPSGLYLNHVFDINPRLFQRMGKALELSRSYIIPSRQRDQGALSGLWKGLAVVSRRYKIDQFFGSVTISNAHHPASRAILVEFLRANHADGVDFRRCVKARNPFIPSTGFHQSIVEAFRGAPIGALPPLIEELEKGQRGIPPLIRYYLNLGARFLDFHIESSFQDALYCLLRVSMAEIPDAWKRRFFSQTRG